MVELQIWTKSDKNRSLTTDLINDITLKLFTIENKTELSLWLGEEEFE